MWAALIALITGLFKVFVNKPAPGVVEAKEAGAAEADLATSQAEVKAVEAEAQAQVNAPHTQAEVVDALKKGTF